MVGRGIGGILDLCGRVLIVSEDEEVIFHAYVKPITVISDYRYPFSVDLMMFMGLSCNYII